MPFSYLDTDPTMAANSNVKVPSQAAVVAYVGSQIAAANALVYKGDIDCSANPNYPAANVGYLYICSVAGKIGGASGVTVEVGDFIICKVNASPAGNQATVGANWNIIQTNLTGAVVGPTSSVSGNFATFNGTSGQVIQDSGFSFSNFVSATLTSAMIIVGSSGNLAAAVSMSGDTAISNTGIVTIANGAVTDAKVASGIDAAKIGGGAVSNTEFGYLDGVTSAIQTQLDGKIDKNLTGAVTSSGSVTSLGSFTSAQLSAALTDETGTGAAVFNTSPAFITPVLGTPTSGTLTNCTGYTVANLAGLGTGVATFLATPSSANLLAAVTDETGTGALVFGTSPTLTGSPAAPTASTGDSSTLIATTAFVKNQGYTTNTGTVTSVDVSVSNGIGVSGNPITTSGTLAFSLGDITPTSLSTAGVISSSRNGASSASTLNLTGTPFAGTGTTSTPLFYSNNSASAPTNWSTGGTYYGINAASGFAGDFVNFYANGVGSLFKITSAGAVTSNSNISSGSRLSTSGNSAASFSAFQASGTWITGASGTTNFPHCLIQPSAASAVATWNTNGTAIGINSASGFTGNFLDFHLNGGTSVLSVASSGRITTADSVVMATAGAAIIWTGNGNTFLTSPAAATISLGNTDAAAPVAQTLSVQNVVAGTSNTAGANFTMDMSRGTGTGVGGSYIVRVAAASSTGSTQNALATALTIDSTSAATFAAKVRSNAAVVTSAGGSGANGPSLEMGFTGYGLGVNSNGETAVLVNNIVKATIGFGVAVDSANGYSWANTTNAGTNATRDTFLTRAAAANIRHGQADAAAPVAQTVSMQSVVAGTTNTAGANFTQTMSQGTGTGIGGSWILQVAPAGSTGSTQNALVTALTIDSTKLATFAGGVTITGTLTASLAASSLTSGTLGAGVGIAGTPYNAGTFSTGTYTPVYSNGNFQYATNNGAHTLAPPAAACTIVIEYVNGASAGTITTSGFTKVTGDSLTTTNGSKFFLYITKHQTYSSLNVQALQ